MAANRYAFGEFTLDPDRASLMRGDAQIALRPKSFDVLRYLVENPGRIVSKDELIGAAWADVVVTDDSLAKCIQEIREALADRPQRYVKTMPRRGYLFDVPVTVGSPEAAPASSAAPPVPEPASAPEAASPDLQHARVPEAASPDPQHARVPEAASPAPELAGASGAASLDPEPAAAPEAASADLQHAPAPGAASPRQPGAALTPGTSRAARVGSGIVLAIAVLAIAGIAVNYALNGGSDVTGEPQTVAVLPFLNFSSDPDQEYFSDGLAEELLNKLAKLDGLRVTARTSSFTFKGSNEDIPTIAAKLGVENVVEGSVRRDGDSIRVTAQLIEGKTGTHLWSETYERELDSIFAIQDDIAESIAAELSLTLGIADREKLRSGTQSVEAFDHYLSGIALLNEFGVQETTRGIEELKRATEIDPGYADAWAVLALANVQTAYFVTADFERAGMEAERAAGRALALNPDLAPAHAALAYVHAQRGEWTRAEQDVRTAVSIPSDFTVAWDYAELLQAAGYLEEALEYRKQTRQALSFNVGPAVELAVAYYQMGDDESAAAEIKRAAGLVGDLAVLDDARIAIAMARRDEGALRRLLDQRRTAGDATAAMLESLLDSPGTAPAELRRQRDSLRDDPQRSVRLASWAAYFGEPTLAVELARDYAVEGTLGIQRFWLPSMRDARGTQAFKDLVRDMGLVDYWRVRGWPTLCRPVGEDDFECG